MRDKLDRPYIRIVLVLLIILIAYFQYKRTQNRNMELQKTGRYTTGKTTGWTKNFRSSDYDLDYEYNVNYHHYKTSMKIRRLGDVISSGGKYIVVYIPNQPSKSKILIDKPVKSYEYPPIDGWTNIPDSVLMLEK